MTEHRYERLSTSGGGCGGIDDQGIANNNGNIELHNDIRIDTNFNRSKMIGTAAGIHSKILHLAIGTLILILLYLSLSICLTFYQGWLLKDIKFPLSIISYHLLVKLILSGIVRCIYKLTSGKSRVILDFRTSLKKMAPTGLASGIDIGFSNWGLELVKISLYTMTKSSTIIFILFFAIILGLEKKSWSLFIIVVMISGGLFMFTYKSTQFDTFGFAFVLFASLASGIRWTFAQLIMQKSKLGLHNPIDMMYHMQPWMMVSILPFAIGFEGKRLLDVLSEISNTSYEDIVYILLKVSTGAFIAFIMEISEYLVLSYTSSLTLSIAGIFKDICQLVLAVELNDEQLSLTNIIGLMLCLGGICCHVIHKYTVISLNKNDNDNTMMFSIDNINNLKSSSTKNDSSIKTMTSLNLNKRILLRKNSSGGGQNIPLLNSNGDKANTDTDDIDDDDDDDNDSQNDENQNSSEVIFDILKRRDATRR